MQDGTLGHKARQKQLKEKGWSCEVPLACDIDCDAVCIHLSGRMDGFCDGEVPAIEEIKLWQGKDDPVSPYPAHLAQAVCYAWMLFQQRPSLESVDIQIVYVTRAGRLRGKFENRYDRTSADQVFHSFLDPYLTYLHALYGHRSMRNDAIRKAAFPYPVYRAGQREYAIQVYTAIHQKKRLFASMPTGTGKSIASLFPAIKALEREWTSQIFYLTARTTQRQGPQQAAGVLQLSCLWLLTLDAKERACPENHVCHPDYCPRAKGHFLRDTAALLEMMQCSRWSEDLIRETADRYQLCPFEFNLSLCEIADLVICDYNYALDPSVHIQRVFDTRHDITLLFDEAHHLLPRVRDMLSGQLDGQAVRKIRHALGKKVKRSHPLYKALTDVMNQLDLLPLQAAAIEGTSETSLQHVPTALLPSLMALSGAYLDSQSEHISWDDDAQLVQETFSDLLRLIHALQRDPDDYFFLLRRRRFPLFKALCLNAAGHFAHATAGFCGTICFSATFDPLPDMKLLLGGTDEDACFSVPSPFPPEHLLVLQASVNVRYTAREQAVAQITELIRTMVHARSGKYLVFFPSFAFLHMTDALLSQSMDHSGDLIYQVQSSGMDLASRDAFLSPYLEGDRPVLSLCVLGGIFSEGIDLPGDKLNGVVIVGVGLPQIGPEQDALRAWYESHLGHGFRYAYQIPGMQKVSQAAGRVIRSETDRGVILLIDDRFRMHEYMQLAPLSWDMQSGKIKERLASFWAQEKQFRMPAGHALSGEQNS